ncbi:MAG: VOC family protein [Actinomycetes bacterium]
MRHPHGLFGWVDLSTTDIAAARAFYQGLFGWSLVDMPTPVGVPYTMAFQGDKVVAGMAPQPPDQAQAGMPSMWNSYILVDDLDEVLAAVEPAGGTVTMPAMDVMTQGRMAMIADPSGAVVGLWEPQDHQGADLFNAPGSLAWNELQSRDRDAAIAFYADVIGWTWNKSDDPDNPDGPEYFVAEVEAKPGDDKSTAGAMTTPDLVPAEVPSMWYVYFAVGDCDASVARALELGGSVVFPAMKMGPGRFAGLTDPTGAMFMVGAFDDM